MQYPHSNPGENVGLAQVGSYRWAPPATLSSNSPRAPIDFLVPRSKQHTFVLEYLMKRLRHSEQRMTQFYGRWQANELRMQAYVTLPKYDEMVRDIRDSGKVKAPDEIVVPYAWATTQTITTYLLHTFGGRKPIIQVGAYRGEQVKRAKNMETLLQYNTDYEKYVYHLKQLFDCGEIYGLAIQRNTWKREEREKSVMRPPSPTMAYMMQSMGRVPQPTRVQERSVCFEGNSISTINPFMFFPDPRVPMVDVAKKGEYVFWRDFMGRHQLLRAQAAGKLKWVESAPATNRTTNSIGGSESMSSIRAFGDSLTSGSPSHGDGIASNYQVDQCSIEIIPAELGLGQSRNPEKWIFTILNGGQIVQAEPLKLNHGQHPLSVAEPNAFGHSFGNLATVDLLAPMQELMSWLINSHMFNVRAALNNFLVVDPTRVEMEDLLDPLPGGILRLKSTPWGQVKPQDAIHQLQVGDVTRSHLADYGLVNRMGNDLTGASDNIRGMQDGGSRKTATEVRTSIEGGASRLASRAMIYSATAITPGAEQWASNYQQFLSMEMEMRVLGQNGAADSVRISPEEIEGDFYFPIHDGTLPLDRVALLDVWEKILTTAMTEPTGMLRTQYDMGAIFEFVAQMSGAQNIAQFKVADPNLIQKQAGAGNLVPLSQLPGALGNMQGGMPTPMAGM